ncbi:hypothetical protein ACFWAP_03995 [Streptomyces goshikiensis]|uniref:hypothetical protein n=1 Tax=Streptomyces goshikiensis TaxID=1942 RepID=UPI00364A6662
MSTNCNTPHDPRKCRLCAPLRHPAHVKTRRALAIAMNAQRKPLAVEMDAENGGAS